MRKIIGILLVIAAVGVNSLWSCPSISNITINPTGPVTKGTIVKATATTYTPLECNLDSIDWSGSFSGIGTDSDGVAFDDAGYYNAWATAKWTCTKEETGVTNPEDTYMETVTVFETWEVSAVDGKTAIAKGSNGKINLTVTTNPAGLSGVGGLISWQYELNGAFYGAGTGMTNTLGDGTAGKYVYSARAGANDTWAESGDLYVYSVKIDSITPAYLAKGSGKSAIVKYSIVPSGYTPTTTTINYGTVNPNKKEGTIKEGTDLVDTKKYSITITAGGATSSAENVTVFGVKMNPPNAVALGDPTNISASPVPAEIGVGGLVNWTVVQGGTGSGVFNEGLFTGTGKGSVIITVDYKIGEETTTSGQYLVDVFKVNSVIVSRVPSSQVPVVLGLKGIQAFKATVKDDDEPAGDRTAVLANKIVWSLENAENKAMGSVIANGSDATYTAPDSIDGDATRIGNIVATVCNVIGNTSITINDANALTSVQILINETASADDDNLSVGSSTTIKLIPTPISYNGSVFLTVSDPTLANFGGETTIPVNIVSGSGSANLTGKKVSITKNDLGIVASKTSGGSSIGNGNVTVVDDPVITMEQNIVYTGAVDKTVTLTVNLNNPKDSDGIVLGCSPEGISKVELGTIHVQEGASIKGKVDFVYNAGNKTSHENILSTVKGTKISSTKRTNNYGVSPYQNTSIMFNYAGFPFQDFSIYCSDYNDNSFRHLKNVEVRTISEFTLRTYIKSFLYSSTDDNQKSWMYDKYTYNGIEPVDIIARACIANNVNPYHMLIIMNREQGVLANVDPTNNGIRNPMGMTNPFTNDFKESVDRGIREMSEMFEVTSTYTSPFYINNHTAAFRGADIIYSSSGYQVNFLVYNSVTAIQFKKTPDMQTDYPETAIAPSKSVDSVGISDATGPLKIPYMFKKYYSKWQNAIGEN